MKIRHYYPSKITDRSHEIGENRGNHQGQSGKSEVSIDNENLRTT